MESDNAHGEVFLFTSESVGEGHPGMLITTVETIFELMTSVYV